MMRNEVATIIAAALLLVEVNDVDGFFLPSSSCCCNTLHSKLFGPDEGDQRDEGEALAKQFYEQIRKREKEGLAPLSPATSGMADSSTLSSSEIEDMPVKQKKFTGARPTDPEPAPFGSSSDGFSQRQSPREQMMEREFQLVGRAEKGLKFQAILAVCVFILYAYVGLTGGIQSETDFSMDNLGDDLINDAILPQARDTEPSFWL